MTEGARPGVPRRTVVAGLFAAVLPTAGCGIRLEDDAPRRPPGADPHARAGRGRAGRPDPRHGGPGRSRRHRARRPRRRPGDPPPPAAHRAAQHAAGRRGARRPTSTRRRPPHPAPTATPSRSRGRSVGLAAPPPPGTRTQLAAAEGASAAAAAGVRRASSPTCGRRSRRCTPSGTPRRPSCAGARRPCRSEPVARRPGGGPGDARPPAAIYFLEVVSARSTGGQRARADTTLAALRALRPTSWPEAPGPDDSLGHPLPFPVDDAADAARLARQALTSLRAGYGEHLEPIVTSDGGAGLAALTRWLGTVEVEAHRWGVDARALPGSHVSAGAAPRHPAPTGSTGSPDCRPRAARRAPTGPAGPAPAR